MRTFVAAADTGQFQEAAVELSITQQAVSKRIAALEQDLGVRLFTRTPRGAQLTIDGQALLPHARDLLQVEERAAASVRPGRRALRVDVIGRRLAPAGLLRDFHRAHPETELAVVTLPDADAAIAAVRSGTIDASFRAVTIPARHLPDGIATARVFDEPIQLLTGPAHEFAAIQAVTLAELAGHRIWMPGIATGTDWAAYYDELAAAFGLTIDAIGPNFGTDPSWTRSPTPPHWRPSSAGRPGSCGPPTTTCGASPCTTRRPSTRIHWSGAATTRTPHSPHSASTSAPPSPAPHSPAPHSPALTRGRRAGHSARLHRVTPAAPARPESTVRQPTDSGS